MRGGTDLPRARGVNKGKFRRRREDEGGWELMLRSVDILGPLAAVNILVCLGPGPADATRSWWFIGRECVYVYERTRLDEGVNLGRRGGRGRKRIGITIGGLYMEHTV